MKDPIYKLRSATRRAKSDVANKLISMCLHELSRRISQEWPITVDGEEYERLVRQSFNNHCPYCSCDLTTTESVIEHLDGMNRYRAGLHVPGNVLVACRRCNGEKRRDDSLKTLLLAGSGWESFLSHDDTRCVATCRTCRYWESIWLANEILVSLTRRTSQRTDSDGRIQYRILTRTVARQIQYCNLPRSSFRPGNKPWARLGLWEARVRLPRECV